MLHQVNPGFSASRMQHGMEAEWWGAGGAGTWEVTVKKAFLELLSVVGSVAAALAFSKNTELLRCSLCKGLGCL